MEIESNILMEYIFPLAKIIVETFVVKHQDCFEYVKKKLRFFEGKILFGDFLKIKKIEKFPKDVDKNELF